MFEFFPSRTLTWYLARTFVTRIVAILVMLVLVLMMLDLLSRTGDILAVEGNGEAELLRYVGLRIPQLVSRFLPYSVLLATIITLATFNQNSEITSMKAAGLSAHQILAPLLLAGLATSLISFAFNERVVTKSTAALKAWTAVDYGDIPDDPDSRTNIFLNDGNDVLMARLVEGEGVNSVLTGITFYDRDDSNMIVRQVRGEQAVFANPGWRIEDPQVFNVSLAELESPVEEITIAPGLDLAQLALRRVDPDSETLVQLSRNIKALKSSGRRTAELEAKWWHKISGPLSAFLMPLLGAVAGFGLARSGGLFARAVIGMALGFAYFVVDNAALAMASFGGYPPLLAAWAPFFLFLFVGEAVLIRTEE